MCARICARFYVRLINEAQCVLIGKAQVAFSSLSLDDCKDYDRVKAAVLKLYECVPEAYRQHFRLQKKEETQTHLEFVRDLRKHFNRCTAVGVKTLDDLRHLMILEQFKNSVLGRVATYIGEHNVKMPEEAAVLADDFVLMHKSVFSDWRACEMQVAVPVKSSAVLKAVVFSRGNFT